MPTIEESIQVNVPARTAYNQWTQFEVFPRFMQGVEEVKQLDERTLRWRAKVGGVEQQWEAVITEQIPDKRIAWTSTVGSANSGCVSFHRLSDHTTNVMVQIGYEPESIKESIGQAIGVVQARVQKDLRSFKEFIEKLGRETGEWRGEIASPDER